MERRILVGVVLGAAGGAVAIWLMETASTVSGFPLILIPFATSIVLVMGSPAAEPAQPRALIGGHLVSTLIGLVLVKLIGPAPWVAALAVGLAMIAMHLTRTFHPPAGIDPVVAVLNEVPWTFLVAPVAIGACALALFAFLWHNLVAIGSWPAGWHRSATKPD
jgi:CBS-domain-containing membrane protein